LDLLLFGKGAVCVYFHGILDVSYFSLGIAFAQPPLIQILSNAKAPYNISTPTAHLALAALQPTAVKAMRSKISTLVSSRAFLLQSVVTLCPLGLGTPIGASDGNFILVPVLNRTSGAPDNERAYKLYEALAEENQIVVRFRGNEPGCTACLRITVGTDKEMVVVLKKLEELLKIL
jgi:histidinol-phosphate aminotransferase